MKWLLYIVGGLAVLMGLIFLVGFFLPAQTTITRSITLKQPPEAVFAVLADVKHLADWNRNTEKVELLPPVNGKEATKHSFKGGMTMTIITTQSTPPQHLVRTLGGDGGPFAGSWTYAITPVDGGGSSVALTEVARFENPLYRVLTRMFGQTKYIDEHLEDLAKKFGETVKVS